MSKSKQYRRPVYVVDGLRTPFLKMRGKPGPFSAADLAVAAGRQLLARQPFLPHDLDEVIMGCVMPNADEANIARIIALRLGCGKEVPAWTVQRNCGSGMQSIDNACQNIGSGRSDLILAGGTEAMSRAPLVVNEKMTAWIAAFSHTKSFRQKAKLIAQLRPTHFKPVIALIKGLSDPLVGLNMGQTAEILAYQFGISRLDMDAFAVESHQRCARSYEAHFMQAELANLYDSKGNVYLEDDGLRPESTIEKLAALKPFFDKKFGMVTAGNSSQITDGAALLVLASERAVQRYELPVLGQIIDTQWAGVSPEVMGLGPAHAVVPLLQRQGLSAGDVDYWEINEAFAAQVVACLNAWEDPEYCRAHFGGLAGAFARIDRSKINIDGGAIALGHPVGASGARIVLHLLRILNQKKVRRGVASLCIGGGQGGAMLVEKVGGL